MNKNLIMMLLLLFSVSIVFPQSKKEEKASPDILQIAIPIYPMPAIHLGLEETIRAELKINNNGVVTSATFDRGAKMFRVVIDDALKRFRFETSVEKERYFDINFIFSLLPYESKGYVTSIFKSPNNIEVFAKRIKILQSVDY